MPTCAALAPATSTAPTAAPVPSPPAATSGASTAARTSWSAASSVKSEARSSSTNTPRWPPASTPCTISASGSSAIASRASSGEVTVIHSADPAARSRAAASFGGSPNVNETTATRASTSASTFALERVVVEARRAERHARALGVTRQPGGVGLDRRRVRGRAAADEQVHAERALRQPARGGDVLGEPLSGQVARAEKPEAAGLADGGGEGGRRRPARHRRLHDRELQQVRYFAHTETCLRLALENGSRLKPLQRSCSRMPASWAIRSYSAGQA